MDDRASAGDYISVILLAYLVYPPPLRAQHRARFVTPPPGQALGDLCNILVLPSVDKPTWAKTYLHSLMNVTAIIVWTPACSRTLYQHNAHP